MDDARSRRPVRAIDVSPPLMPQALRVVCRDVERVADLRPEQLYALIASAVEIAITRATRTPGNQ